jgi:ABC-type phosphate transport system substrate-binding protein
MGRLAIIAAVLLVVLGAGAALSAQPGSVPKGPAIIVHPNNPTTVLDRKFIADAFLRKTTRWPNGETIKPVDLRPSLSVRRTFSEAVVGRSVEAVRNYWQQRIFSGRDLPPPELDSEEEVVAYVLKHSNAVGYVSLGTNLNGARTVTVR